MFAQFDDGCSGIWVGDTNHIGSNLESQTATKFALGMNVCIRLVLTYSQEFLKFTSM